METGQKRVLPVACELSKTSPKGRILQSMTSNDFNINCSLKVNGPNFQRIVFCFILRNQLSLQRCKFKISVETVKPFGWTKQFCIFQWQISYCVSFIMATITRHIFINIFENGTLFNCEICHGLWEKYELRPRKKKPVLRARPTAFLPICRFFFFYKKNIIKSAIFSSKNLSEKMRAKWAENFWIYKRFLGQFGKKKKKKKKKKSPDRPTAFWNLFARRTGFFFRGLTCNAKLYKSWKRLKKSDWARLRSRWFTSYSRRWTTLR